MTRLGMRTLIILSPRMEVKAWAVIQICSSIRTHFWMRRKTIMVPSTMTPYQAVFRSKNHQLFRMFKNL
jgi:hypothetical protein